MILSDLVYDLFGYCNNPVELACRFLIVLLIFEGIFGIVGSLLSGLISKR